MSTDNIYLTTPIGPLFIKTAVPIILVMLVNGLFTVVDAYFLGQYVGADALVAITLIFPLYIFLIALTTLVSGGFSSIYARQIGAADPAAAATFTSAIQLSLAVCGVLFIVFALQGGQLTHWIAQGDTNLAARYKFGGDGSYLYGYSHLQRPARIRLGAIRGCIAGRRAVGRDGRNRDRLRTPQYRVRLPLDCAVWYGCRRLCHWRGAVTICSIGRRRDPWA